MSLWRGKGVRIFYLVISSNFISYYLVLFSYYFSFLFNYYIRIIVFRVIFIFIFGFIRFI